MKTLLDPEIKTNCGVTYKSFVFIPNMSFAIYFLFLIWISPSIFDHLVIQTLELLQISSDIRFLTCVAEGKSEVFFT